MMKTNILILSLLCSGLNAGAQQAYLSREEYRDKVEAYSQILKQQHLKTFASTEARKIASTGFLPQIDITAEASPISIIWTNGTVRKETTTLIPIRHLPP